MNNHVNGRERPINEDAPRLTETRLVFLGGILGLAPALRNGNGQPLVEAITALRAEELDFALDAEFMECELFVPEDRT